MIRSSMKLLVFVSIIAGLFVLTVNAANVTVNPAIEYQALTGIGGSDDENGPESRAQAVVNELGASTFRLFHDFDLYDFEKTNDNNDPNTFNWSAFNTTQLNKDIRYMKYLQKAGVKHFFYSVLAWPFWLKINVPQPQSGVAFWCSGQCGGDFDTTQYAEYAECLTAWVKVFKDSGIVFNSISLQNEPTFNEPYGSCRIFQPQMRNLAKIVGARFEKEGITSKIFASEEVLSNWMSVRSYVTTMSDDAACRKYLNASAVHNYAGDGITATSPAAMAWDAFYKISKKYNLDTWMTETSGFGTDWAGAMRAAQVMFSAFKYGKLSLWAWLDYPNASELDLAAITKNYSKYIRPGAIQIESISTDTANVVVLTFRDKVQKKLVAVVINRSGSPATVTLTGTGMPAQLHRYESASGVRFVDRNMVDASSFTVLANSINTVVGDGYDPVVGVVDRAQANPAFTHSTGPVSVYDLHGRVVPRRAINTGAGTGVYLSKTGTGNLNLTKRVVSR